MAQPRNYTRQFNFNDFQTTSPATPLPGTQVDAELNTVKLTLDDLNTNIALIQQDDGKIKNQSVHKDSFDAGALALMKTGSYTIQGDWTASRSYAVGDLVDNNGATYVATSAHTSSSAFETDLTANKWILIANAGIANTASTVDKFEGTGSQTAFTLSSSYTSNTDVMVFVNGALKNPGDDFSISTNTITFVTAPSAPAVSGNENVIVFGSSVVAQAAKEAAQLAQTNASGFANEADNWARLTTGLVESTDYSSKAYAIGGTGVDAGSGSAKDWATKTSGTVGNTGEYSAKYYATNANVGTVATNIANINTTAGLNTEITAVAGKATEIGLLGQTTPIANMALLGTSTVVGNMGLLGTSTVVGHMANLNASGVIADIGTVAGQTTQLGLLGTSDAVADMNLLATSGNITFMSNLGTTANVTAMGNLGTTTNVTNMANLNASGVIANMANLNASGVIANIGTTAGISSEIATVAGISSAVSNVSGISSEIQTVNTNIAKVQATANDLLEATSEIDTVANSIANVDAVGGAISNVNTVANNIAGVNSFSERYRVQAGVPSSSNDLGDLVFDTSANTLKVFGTSGFQNAGSSVNGTSNRFTYNISGTPTTVSGADANGETLAFDPPFLDVYLNGVKMSPADITVSSGNSVVFASALAAGDVVDIVAFGTFQLANINASNITSGTVPSARLSGAIISSWETKTSAFNVEAGRGYFVDTSSSAVTATLPASPTAGDTVRFIDLSATFDTNNLTVARNSKKIQGDASDLTVATERAGLALVFSGDTQGWLLMEK